ncbi:hypothetical protein INS49_007745 [Diaporthe citri]|uniref:uncharacterized protein n=1 Tax=Diaporthe citri TaxID=83186 RepID=UPI001C80CF5B|nr:uncharacterized protein INS49_007745 [Diaporthe citri]KAG6362653.1 hypothetical protein INS49_007745 [Diaporthe citri]
MKRLSELLIFASVVLAQDPGLPNANPNISYWQLPPLEGVADHQSAQLPTDADIVIIGSGISGTSIAWHLIKEANRTTPLRIAMLEARQGCSGSTGRNGGHIGHPPTPNGRLAAEARVVDSMDAFFDDAQWKTAVQQMEVLKKEVPDIAKDWAVFEREEARNISLIPEVTGIMTGTAKMAGAIWPYRFITHSLKSLLETYPSFSLDTNTAALNVSSLTGPSSSSNYEVLTTRGRIQTKHVVYATNAWTPHFVPGLQGATSGGLLHMSAQLGGSGLPKAGALPGGRAWSLFRNGLDYVVQMPRNGEYMFGGGAGGEGEGGPGGNSTALERQRAAQSRHGVVPQRRAAQLLRAAAGPSVYPGRTKRVWVGIEGGSRDSRPFVGLLPQSAAARPVKNASAVGEWVSAAFDGEGMCFAWLCGRPLSQMIASGKAGGQEAAGVPEWFPRSFLVTEQRLASRNVTRREAHHWMYPRMAKALSWEN